MPGTVVTVTLDQVRRLAPHARPEYLQALTVASEVLPRYGVTTPLRLAHLMAQILHETGALTIREECLNYHADRLMEVWPSRFRTLTEAEPFAQNPRALANQVYNGRMGNRMGSDDGWTYRGRGLLQLTGREAYGRYGKLLGIDLVGHPELVLDPRHALEIACAEWQASNCNQAADRDDIEGVTRRINGGLIGLDSRKAWLAKTRAVWA